ncbi:MAG: flagellar basal body-associated FliL family protein [Rickettsiaceae bacterium]
MDKKNDDEFLTPQEASRYEERQTEETRADKIKKIIMISIPILIAIFGAIFFFSTVVKQAVNDEPQILQTKKEQAQAAISTNSYLDLEPMVVELAPSEGKKEYLRLHLTLRLATEKERAYIIARLPIIKDSLFTFLCTLRAGDFNNSSNILYVKEEITKRINKITDPIIVKEVLFQEFIVD